MPTDRYPGPIGRLSQGAADGGLSLSAMIPFLGASGHVRPCSSNAYCRTDDGAPMLCPPPASRQRPVGSRPPCHPPGPGACNFALSGNGPIGAPQWCGPTLVRPTGIDGSRTVRLSRNSDGDHPVAEGLRVLISCDDVRREEQNPQDEACNEPHGGRVDLKGADGKDDGSSPFGSLPCIGVGPEICPDGSWPPWVHSSRARQEPRRRVGWE